jgi:hypothetical protein
MAQTLSFESSSFPRFHGIFSVVVVVVISPSALSFYLYHSQLASSQHFSFAQFYFFFPHPGQYPNLIYIDMFLVLAIS